MHVDSYKDLNVYKLVRSLSLDIFKLTKTFPKEERYSLTDQIRRSSRSVDAQIAEAWGKRRYEKHFISKLTDADGEQLETQHWVEVSIDCEYVSDETGKALLEQCSTIERMLNSMMSKSDTFCNKL